MKKIFKRISTLKSLLAEHSVTSYTLFFTSVIASLLEVVGLTMLLPLLNIIINKDSGSFFSEALNDVVGFFSVESELVAVLLLMIIVQLFKSIFFTFQKYLTGKFVWEVTETWTNKLFENNIKNDYLKTVEISVGENNHNIVVEPGNSAALLLKLTDLMAQLVLSMFMIISLLWIDTKITLYIFLFIGSTCLPIVLFSGPTVSRIGKRKISVAQDISSFITESFYNLIVVKMFNLEDVSTEKLKKLNRKLKKLRVLGFTIQGALPPIIELFAVVAIVIVIYLLTGFETEDLREILPRLGTIILISQKLFGKTSGIVSSISKVYMGLPSLRLVNSGLSDKEHVTNDKVSFNSSVESISFSDFGFKYNEKLIFKDLNFSLERGKSYAIVGDSGSGKSTILKVLLRLLENYDGSIKINCEQELRDISTHSLRESFSMVTQDPHLFSVCVKENITFGKKEFTENDILDSIRSASLTVGKLSEEELLAYEIINQGSNLSGGQKQRVNIARALLRKPEVLLLDEFTSSLDHETEEELLRTVEKLKQDKIVILISHKKEIASYVDYVIELP